MSKGPLSEQHAAILADKLFDGQLALFVGAGLSHLCRATDGSKRRLPLWKELAEDVARACHEDVASYRDVLDLFDAIQYGQERFVLEEAVRKSVDDRGFAPSQAHYALAALPWAAILTTNYDGILQKQLDVEPVFDEDGYDRLASASTRQPRLFQIHGTLSNPHTLTREDYRDWAARHPRAYRHLEGIVLNKTVLFVGYSLSDPHLDAVLTSVRRMTAGREKRLYAWMWALDDGQARLLDRRDKVEAVSMQDEKHWAAAFQQLDMFYRRRAETDRPVTIAVTTDPFGYDRQQYLAALKARYGVADLQGLYLWGAGYSRDDVTLDEIFVEPDLDVSERDDSTRQVAAETTATDRGLSLKSALAARLARKTTAEGHRESALGLTAREAKLLIVGAPGQGKSTLLRRILLETASKWAESPDNNPFPALVRLSDWEADVGPTEGRLLAQARDRIRRLSEIGSAAIEAWARKPVLWLLDGIDEIRDEHARERLREDIAATAVQRPLDRFVVTTRPAGEPLTGIGAGWRRAAMSRLTPLQVREILSKWAVVLQRKEGLQLDARDLERSLESDPGLREIRTNALLLTLTVLFFKSRGRLPHGRWEFYDAAEQALRDAWVRHRLRDAREHLPGDYLPELLERIALCGMEEGTVLFELDRLQVEARDVLANRGYTKREQDQETARFTRAAEDLIGVLVEQGPGRFGFLHLTFQEFFAARALVHRSHEAAGYIKRHWHHAAWRELLLLYLLGVQADPRRYQEVFESILTSGHELDAHLFRPRLAALLLAGVGSAPLPSPAIATIDWAEHVLRQGAYPAAAVLSRFARWERPWPPAIRSIAIKIFHDDASPYQRNAAAALASALNDSDIRMALFADVEKPSVAIFLARALSRTPIDANTADVYFRFLERDPYLAADCLRLIAGDGRIRQGLVQRLKGPNDAVRQGAARALVDSATDEQVREALLDLLEDESALTRRAAMAALTEVSAEPTVRDKLLKLTRVADSFYAKDALEALSNATVDQDVRRTLLSYLKRKDQWFRTGAAHGLVRAAHDDEVRKALMVRRNDKSRFVRFAVVEALAPVATLPDVRRALLTKSRDEYEWVRNVVVMALSPFATEAPIAEALRERALAEDEVEITRVRAAEALVGLVADATIKSMFMQLLSDPSVRLRRSACRGLTSVAIQPDIRRILLAKLSDQAPEVQLAAAEALDASIAAEEPA